MPKTPEPAKAPALPDKVDSVLVQWWADFFTNLGPIMPVELYNRANDAKEELRVRLAATMTEEV